MTHARHARALPALPTVSKSASPVRHFVVERTVDCQGGDLTCNLSLSPYPCSSVTRLYFRRPPPHRWYRHWHRHRHRHRHRDRYTSMYTWCCTLRRDLAATRRARRASRKEGLYTRTGILQYEMLASLCIGARPADQPLRSKRHKHQIFSTSSVPLHCSRRAFQPTRQPHIAVFMADDLGYLDTSYAGSTVVRTPHLDLLSLHGTILSQFRAPTWYLCHTFTPTRPCPARLVGALSLAIC